MLLARACRDRRSPWRTPVLATAGLDGAPRARTLVLRRADRANGLLELHSDTRAGKVAEILAEPRVALSFWDAKRALQLRLAGVARLADAAACDAAWDRVPVAARANYASADRPGAPLGDGAMLADGRPNFAILLVAAQRLDWLWLGQGGHVRGEAVLERSGWRTGPLVP